MPLYEFRCRTCGTEIEMLCSYNDLPKVLTCSECGGQMRRKFSRINFLGFQYADYRKEYLAHRDKHPTAEAEIRFCEEFTGVPRTDDWTTQRKRKVKVSMA